MRWGAETAFLQRVTTAAGDRTPLKWPAVTGRSVPQPETQRGIQKDPSTPSAVQRLCWRVAQALNPLFEKVLPLHRLIYRKRNTKSTPLKTRTRIKTRWIRVGDHESTVSTEIESTTGAFSTPQGTAEEGGYESARTVHIRRSDKRSVKGCGWAQRAAHRAASPGDTLQRVWINIHWQH